MEKELFVVVEAVLVAVLYIASILMIAFVAGAEVAMASTSRTRIHQLLDNGDSSAQVVDRLLGEPARFLSTLMRARAEPTCWLALEFCASFRCVADASRSIFGLAAFGYCSNCQPRSGAAQSAPGGIGPGALCRYSDFTSAAFFCPLACCGCPRPQWQ